MGGLAEVTGWLRERAPVTVLTGAGVSTDSGMPDYRGPHGLWSRGGRPPPGSASYREDPALRRLAWQRRRAHPAWLARPNPAHRALVSLERSGRLGALLTQNIDGLHQLAGSDPELVVELHGTLRQARCLDCDARLPMAAVLDRVAAGEADPACTGCGGVLSSATVGFGDPVDRALLARAVLAARGCAVFLAVGSSLRVQPVAGLCRVAAESGARLVIVNAQPTPYDAMAAAVVRAPIGEVLPRLVA